MIAALGSQEADFRLRYPQLNAPVASQIKETNEEPHTAQGKAKY